MAASFKGLDLSKSDDRSLYRLRVEEEFQMTKFSVIKQHANKLLGTPEHGTRGFKTRREAIRVIAGYRMVRQGVAPQEAY